MQPLVIPFLLCRETGIHKETQLIPDTTAMVQNFSGHFLIPAVAHRAR